MTINIEKISHLKRKIHVSEPASEIDQKAMDQLQKLQPKVNLAGFRPGKVPIDVIKQRYGKSAREEVISNFVYSTYTETLEKEKLKPAGMPKIDLKETNFGQDVEFEINFEIIPEIKLAKMKGITITKLVADVTDQDVENTLQRLRKEHAKWEEVDNEASLDNQLIIDVEATCKKEPIQILTKTDLKLNLGEKFIHEDFDKALIGAKTGAKLDFKIKFDKGFANPNLAGKKIEFIVQVKKVLHATLPEIDADFLSKFNITEGGIEALRTKIRESMQNELKQTLTQNFKTQILDKFVEINPIDIPEVMINNETLQLTELAKKWQAKAKTENESTEDYQKIADKRIRISLLSSALMAQENIKIDPAKVRAKVEAIAASYGKTNEVINWFYQDKKNLAEIENMVLEEQIIENLSNQFTIVEKTVTYEEAIKHV